MHYCWTLFVAIAFLKECLAATCFLENPGDHVIYHCSVNGKHIPCSSNLDPETIVEFQCSEYFELQTNNNTSSIKCLKNGNWTSPIPTCVPICGKLSSVVPLIVHGKVIDPGLFPWQVALYHNYSDGWQFACGGNLISTRMVVTAAHCAWHIGANDIKVALGKRYRDELVNDETSQMIQVAEIEKLDSYQDSAGNYNGDLALLLLKEPAKISSTVSPICIDWQLEFIDQQLVEGNSGIALGWGLTENDTFSTELRAVRLPVMSDEHCIKQQQRDFKKYITYTSFCAGYNNGTGVCNGDSGGGLAFLEPVSDTWYLQGVVSVSPRRRGTPYCDPTYYTVFTKVAMFSIWLQKMKEKELMIEKAETKVIAYN